MSKFNRDFFVLLASQSEHAVLVLGASLGKAKDIDSLKEFVSVLKDEMRENPSVEGNSPFQATYPGENGSRSIMLNDIFIDALATTKDDRNWSKSQEEFYEISLPLIAKSDTTRLDFLGDAPDKIYDPRCMRLMNVDDGDDVNYSDVIFSKAIKSGNIPVMRALLVDAKPEIIEACMDSMLLDRKFKNLNQHQEAESISGLFQNSATGRQEVIDLMNDFQSEKMNHMRVSMLFEQFEMWSKKGQAWDAESICQVMGVYDLEDAKKRIVTCLKDWDPEACEYDAKYRPKGINLEQATVKQLLDFSLNSHCLPIIETLKHFIPNAVDDDGERFSPLAKVMSGCLANKEHFKETVELLLDKGYKLSVRPSDESNTMPATVALAKAEGITDKSEKLFALLEMGAEVGLRSRKFKKASLYCPTEERDQWDSVISAYNARNAAMDVMALLSEVSPKSSPKI